MGKLKASRQFQNRNVWDVSISLVAEDFRQKKDVLEDSSRHCLFTNSDHCDLPSKKTKALHRMNDERLCSSVGTIALIGLPTQWVCQSVVYENRWLYLDSRFSAAATA
jgi:hypothetical protein